MDQTEQVMTVGIDLAKDYTQVSYLNEENEVVSMSTIKGEQRYQIPTLLFKYWNKDMWCIGEEAILRQKEGQGILIRNLLNEVIVGSVTEIEGREYFASELLEVYFKEVFKMVQLILNTDKINNVVVSVPTLEKTLMDAIFDGVARIGVSKNCIKIIGHAESFVYYVLNQKRDLWVNSVAMFDFSQYGFEYMKMTVTGGRTPAVISVERRDYSEEMSYKLLETAQGRELLDQKFTQIIQQEFAGNIISSVFLVGEGFKLAWAKNTLPLLCAKRRVFQGDNLFAKGAGFDAKEVFYVPSFSHYLLQCEGRTRVNIGLMVEHGTRDVEHILSYAGVNYYEGGAKTECILDHTDSLRFCITSPITGISRVMTMKLDDLPKRPNKTTRICITISYKNESQFTIQVEDRGFGEFFEASDKVYREDVMLEEI